MTTYSLLALALDHAGRTPESMRLYREIIANQPEYAEARFNLALMLLKQSHPAEALEHFTAFTRIMPLDPDGHEGRGDALSATRNLAESIRAFETSLRLNTQNHRVRRKLALALHDAGHNEEALVHLESILHDVPAATEIQELRNKIHDIVKNKIR